MGNQMRKLPFSALFVVLLFLCAALTAGCDSGYKQGQTFRMGNDEYMLHQIIYHPAKNDQGSDYYDVILLKRKEAPAVYHSQNLSTGDWRQINAVKFMINDDYDKNAPMWGSWEVRDLSFAKNEGASDFKGKMVAIFVLPKGTKFPRTGILTHQDPNRKPDTYLVDLSSVKITEENDK